MENEVFAGIKNALMRTNMSTYEIAEAFKVSEREVLDIMTELDFIVV